MNRQPVEFGLEVVTLLGSTFKRESFLGRQINTSEVNTSGFNLSRDVSLEVALDNVLSLVVAWANIDPLSADAELVGLLLDQVNRDGRVGKSVQTTVDSFQWGDDLLLLGAPLNFTVVFFAIFTWDTGALVLFRVRSLLVEHVGVGSEAILVHDALLGALQVSGVFSIEVSAQTASATVDELGSNNFNTKTISDDLK